ncbi:hypothetical protein KM043_017112 [Ampulex compressa]|nr:hypothetical protein KM043_017112 [Ampulex compressa]
MGSVASYFLGHTDENVLDSATGLTGRQKRLVRETWAVFRGKPVDTGVAILTRYFEKHPKYQQEFDAFKSIPLNELPRNRKFQAHCQSIIVTLSNAFDALDDVPLMEATLLLVGERHGKRGQGRQEFMDLKEVIMEVLKSQLGAKFNSEVEESWDKTIDAAFSVIFTGIEESHCASSKVNTVPDAEESALAYEIPL